MASFELTVSEELRCFADCRRVANGYSFPLHLVKDWKQGRRNVFRVLLNDPIHRASPMMFQGVAGLI